MSGPLLARPCLLPTPSALTFPVLCSFSSFCKHLPHFALTCILLQGGTCYGFAPKTLQSLRHCTANSPAAQKLYDLCESPGITDGGRAKGAKKKAKRGQAKKYTEHVVSDDDLDDLLSQFAAGKAMNGSKAKGTTPKGGRAPSDKARAPVEFVESDEDDDVLFCQFGTGSVFDTFVKVEAEKKRQKHPKAKGKVNEERHPEPKGNETKRDKATQAPKLGSPASEPARKTSTSAKHNAFHSAKSHSTSTPKKYDSKSNFTESDPTSSCGPPQSPSVSNESTAHSSCSPEPRPKPDLGPTVSRTFRPATTSSSATRTDDAPRFATPLVDDPQPHVLSASDGNPNPNPKPTPTATSASTHSSGIHCDDRFVPDSCSNFSHNPHPAADRTQAKHWTRGQAQGTDAVQDTQWHHEQSHWDQPTASDRPWQAFEEAQGPRGGKGRVWGGRGAGKAGKGHEGKGRWGEGDGTRRYWTQGYAKGQQGQWAKGPDKGGKGHLGKGQWDWGKGNWGKGYWTPQDLGTGHWGKGY